MSKKVKGDELCPTFVEGKSVSSALLRGGLPPSTPEELALEVARKKEMIGHLTQGMSAEEFEYLSMLPVNDFQLRTMLVDMSQPATNLLAAAGLDFDDPRGDKHRRNEAIDDSDKENKDPDALN